MTRLFGPAAFWACSVIALGQTTTDLFEKLTRDLQDNPKSSLTHFRLGELFFQQKNYQSAANEFRSALTGDLNPSWTELSAHRYLSQIFEITDQHERALVESRAADFSARRLAQTAPVQALPEGVHRLGDGVVIPYPTEA